MVLASTREPQSPSWIPAGVQARVVPWPRRPVQLAWSLGAGPRLERALARLDAVHLLQPFPPVRSFAPQIVTIHDLFPLEYPEWHTPLERWTYRRSIELLTRRAARIVVPSRYVAGRIQEILNLPSSAMEVVPLGVSGVFAGAESADGRSQVCRRFDVRPGEFAVSVGTVSTRKNVLTIVRAAAALAGHEVPLLIIGPDGQGSREVDADIVRLRGRAQIRRTGFLPDDDTAALVSAAGVLLHPALGEGFGFVPLEAMAVGTPVIAARTSAVPEIVGDAAVLVDEPEDPGAWSRAITAIMQDGRRRRELVDAGARRAAQFSWDITAERMLEIYRDVA